MSPDILILSEHLGKKKPCGEVLWSQHYKLKEFSRVVQGVPTHARNINPTAAVTGEGVALIYNEENFFVDDKDSEVHERIETT